MFSSILKIIPKLDQTQLRQMEKTLQARFTRIARGFGRGLMNMLKGGGLIGAAMVLVDKILNPLKEVQEAIERTLKSSDDIGTYANQFNTTSGKLLKLIALGKSAGLEQDNLFMLMSRFQSAVAEAGSNPNLHQSVKNYVGREDIGTAFFDFIQNMQKMSPTDQTLVQLDVFGEKQILKMSEFLQTDFVKRFAEMGLAGVSTEKLTNATDKLAGLADLADTLEARRMIDDQFAKAGVINEGMIRARDKSERIILQRENERIKSYKDLAAISDMTQKIMGFVEQGVALLGKLVNVVVPQLSAAADNISNFLTNSKLLRGIFSFGKDK